jgi:uncharacterized protein
MARRVVTDAIHGSIELSDAEWRIVDTPSFQRLRHLKQLQMAHLTYPNATHTRLAHSLGVFALMRRVLEVAKDALQLEQAQIEDLRLAALLHDIGHYPYSHLMERVDNVQLTEDFIGLAAGRKGGRIDWSATYPKHESLGEQVVTERKDLREAIGGVDRARRVADLFTRSATADPQLSKLIHSSLDMDRFDYLLRDAQATGVPFGSVDLHHLLANVKVSSSGMIGFSHKAVSSAEHFLFARFFMHKVVYYHKTTFGFEEACRQLIRRCRDQRLLGVPASGDAVRSWFAGDQLLDFTDGWVDDLVRKAATCDDPTIQKLATCIIHRRPPALIREVSELKDLSQRGGAEHCKDFLKRCQDRLEGLAKEINVDIRHFLVAGPTSVTLEDRASRLTCEAARKLEDEEREGVVNIFEKGQGEPTALVDIQSSITNVAANHAYQFARLYLVTDDREISRKATERVADW